MAVPESTDLTLTERDEEILTDLFFCRYLSTQQIAALHFNSSSRANTRLNQLHRSGYLTKRFAYLTPEAENTFGRYEVCGARHTGSAAVWTLGKDAFEMVAGGLNCLEKEWEPDPRAFGVVDRHVLANQVYVAVGRPTRKRHSLTGLLGPYPAWEWFHEGRVRHLHGYARREPFPTPLAHLRIGQKLYLIEHHSNARKRDSEAEIHQKLASSQVYIDYSLTQESAAGPPEAAVLFVCEKNTAPKVESIGEGYEPEIFAGTSEQVADSLCRRAEALLQTEEQTTIEGS